MSGGPAPCSVQWLRGGVARAQQGARASARRQGFNRGDLEVVDEIVDPDVVTHNPFILDAPPGPASVSGGIAMIRSSFPDFHAEILDLVAEGDRVAVFLRLSGTNEGDYRRGGASRKRGSFRAFFIWRVANGRLAESWGVADRFDFLQQLGIIPSDDELAARMPGPQGPD
ncbi:MAG TPA: ester cyclase [Acidimicrobiales bacterium]